MFRPGTGTMTQLKAHLSLREQAEPQFCKPRSVPFAIRDRVGKELDHLEEEGILCRVDHSEWAAPIVPVPKKDGSIRICGDFKVTINPALRIDQYPLPKPSDLMACLTGGKRFTKLDLTSAYQQMLLDEASSKLVAINTHQGLYQFTRLSFGVASAPAVFRELWIPFCRVFQESYATWMTSWSLGRPTVSISTTLRRYFSDSSGTESGSGRKSANSFRSLLST